MNTQQEWIRAWLSRALPTDVDGQQHWERIEHLGIHIVPSQQQCLEVGLYGAAAALLSVLQVTLCSGRLNPSPGSLIVFDLAGHCNALLADNLAQRTLRGQ
jgi:hypothetical protein